MSSNDRELLELAGRAAGAKPYDWDTSRDGLFIRDGIPVILHNGDHDADWNPLTDDGDALRLAIHIGIFDGPRSFAKFYPWLSDALVTIDDYATAFKRAVTCYAAEIGRAMP